MLGIISLLPAYDISIVIDGLSVPKLRKRLAGSFKMPSPPPPIYLLWKIFRRK
jgi:hypothetical protein